jgi:hypothetical protein
MADRKPPDAVTEGMKAGGYYDAHSEYQRRVVHSGDAAIRELVGTAELDRVRGAYTIADYGAGTGATSADAVRVALQALRRRDAGIPATAVHNDVITNDFNSVFAAAAADDGYLALGGAPVYPMAAAGSFFTQVAPDGSVDLGLCSNASHWFRDQPSAAPPDSMWFSDAPADVRAKLAEQAAGDWSAFLAARTAELAPGGRLLVQGIGRTEVDDGSERVSAARLLQVMWEVASGLADDGKLDRDALERYVFPVYCRSAEEAAAPVSEGGALAGELELASATVDEVANPYWEVLERDGDRDAYASAYTAFVRAFSESTLTLNLFGPAARGIEPKALCDEYFDRFQAATAADPEAGRYEAWILRVAFARS